MTTFLQTTTKFLQVSYPTLFRSAFFTPPYKHPFGLYESSYHHPSTWPSRTLQAAQVPTRRGRAGSSLRMCGCGYKVYPNCIFSSYPPPTFSKSPPFPPHPNQLSPTPLFSPTSHPFSPNPQRRGAGVGAAWRQRYGSVGAAWRLRRGCVDSAWRLHSG